MMANHEVPSAEVSKCTTIHTSEDSQVLLRAQPSSFVVHLEKDTTEQNSLAETRGESLNKWACSRPSSVKRCLKDVRARY